MAAQKTAAADLTIAELATVLGVVLGVGYEGVRNGRVRDLPDQRTIRWYQTLGVVDRPAALRGRTALFNRRHVLQLAAIKRLQATGLPLADVQRGLAGSSDAELARAAGVRIGDVERCIADVTTARTTAAATAVVAAMRPQPAGAFWKSRPQVESPPAQPVGAVDQPTLQSLALGGHATVVWNGRPLTAAETMALAQLARPVIEFLSSRSASVAAEPAGGSVHPSSARPEESEARP